MNLLPKFLTPTSYKILFSILSFSKTGVLNINWASTTHNYSLHDAYSCFFDNISKSFPVQFTTWSIPSGWPVKFYYELAKQVQATDTLGVKTTAFVFTGLGKFDPKNGSKYVDPRAEAREFISNLKVVGIFSDQSVFVKFNETCEGWWLFQTCTCNENVSWTLEFLDEISLQIGVERAGVFTETGTWNTCLDMNINQYKLAYRGYDDELNYKYFSPFGGWDVPNAKVLLSERYVVCLTEEGMPKVWDSFYIAYEEE